MISGDGSRLFAEDNEGYGTDIATNIGGTWTPASFINQVTISGAGINSVNGVYTRTSSGVTSQNGFSGPSGVINWRLDSVAWLLGGEAYASYGQDSNFTGWANYGGALPLPTGSTTQAQQQIGNPTIVPVIFPSGAPTAIVTNTTVTRNLGTGARTTIQSALTSADPNVTLTLPKQSGTIALRSDSPNFTIAVPNVDIGKTVVSNPLGWSQQVTIPTNIAELTGGLPCVLDSVAIRITNRLGTGQIHASTTVAGGLRVGSQSVLALTPVSGVNTYNADNYFSTLQTGTRPWTGGYTKAFTSGGTFGRSLYTGGNLFINSPIVSGSFRTAYWDATLTEAMDATQTNLAQTILTAGAPSYEGTYLKIDNEVVLITSWLSGTGSRPTILRAQLGTTATTHAVGAPITTNLGSALGGGVLATVYLNFIRVP
jgi:hypothetical protein